MDTAILDEVYRFWFGTPSGPDDFPADKAPIWFQPNPAVDAEIGRTFGPAIPEAAAADWDIGALSPHQQVGLVVLLDQFPRNVHRTSAEAFAYDPAAKRIAAGILALGPSPRSTAERAFLLLPFEHSEAVADQDRAVLLAAQLVADAPPSSLDFARSVLDYATKHRDLIRRFGRFPHRNEWLARPTTEEEAAFLKEHGRGF